MRLRAEVKKTNYHPIWSYWHAAEEKKEKSVKILFYVFQIKIFAIF